MVWKFVILFFYITEGNNKFELYILPDEISSGVSYEKVREEIERDLDILDITATDLQDEKLGPSIINKYRQRVTKRIKDDNYMLISAGYTKSVFQDFESYVRTKVDLVEDDNRLVLDEYNSSFNTSEILPSFYTFKDIFEALLGILQPKYED